MLLIFGACASVKREYCIVGNSFSISLSGNAFTRVNYKKTMDSLINYSNINFNEKSNYQIDLNVNTQLRTSIISMNDDVESQNVIFNVKYNIFDKKNNILIDSGKFIIVENFEIADDRFANFATDNYLFENFAKNLSIRLENIVERLLAGSKCKKN